MEDGFDVDEIILTSGYDEILSPDSTGRKNTYRITGIMHDIIVRVFTVASGTPNAKLADFSSFTDASGNISFGWADSEKFDSVNITVSHGNSNESFTEDGNAWIYPTPTEENVKYSFVFQPMLDGEPAGKSLTHTAYYAPEINTRYVDKVNIVTENHILPSRDLIDSPAHCMGKGIRNNGYRQCLFSLYGRGGSKLYGSSTDDYSAAKIKVRGNTSAYTDKVSFKIKLSKKADLLGSFAGRENDAYKDKEWLLLKSGDSPSSAAGWAISEALGLDFIPAYRYVALTLNGDYKGLYILCESVKQGNTDGEIRSRADIEDNGYVIELDPYWWNEDLYFETTYTLTDESMRYTFKYPDPDDITIRSDEYKYIQNYVNAFENALLNGKENDYADYIDEASFAKWLLGQDILSSIDGAGTNMFFSKKDSADSKLKMFVMWDFDNGFLPGCEKQFAAIHGIDLFVFPKLLQKAAFVEQYIDIYDAVKDEIIPAVESALAALNTGDMNYLCRLEHERYNDLPAENFISKNAKVKQWLISHLEWLDEQIETLRPETEQAA